MAKRHIPLRRCVVCRTQQPKDALVRIVRRPDGQVELDLEQKKMGRGAYLCRQPSCWNLKVALPRLQRALRAPVDEVLREMLLTVKP
jgi:predicted RNA-binding protein YlxR (DUF448 family)